MQRRRTSFQREADKAISIVRDAVSDIFARAVKGCPPWLQDDDDKGWDRGQSMMAHLTQIHAGVDPQGEDAVRISYEYKDREYDHAFLPPGSDHGPHIEALLKSLSIPVAAVRAYRGRMLLYERKVEMRGA